MKYAFMKAHKPEFTIRAQCRMFRVHPSGFYAWLKNPFSKRAKEDGRQTDLIEKAWNESGRIYGYRKQPRMTTELVLQSLLMAVWRVFAP